jgi:hypothetical protein
VLTTQLKYNTIGASGVRLAAIIAKLTARLTRAVLVLVAAVPILSLPRVVEALETKSFAIYWFGPAFNSQGGDCEGGPNPYLDEQYAKDLAALGKTPEEIKALMKGYLNENAGGYGFANGHSVRDLMAYRGRIDGKPVDAYAHPAAVADPKLKALSGKSGYGFNLDGKNSPSAFTDPETGETGVNNQLFRALGCFDSMRGTLQHAPASWAFIWSKLREAAPAWLITLSSENLSNDGAVTFIFDRAIDPLKFDSQGNAWTDVTYRIDPDPRSHHEFRGQRKNGVFTITDHASLRLLQDPLFTPLFRLEKTHLRLTTMADGSIQGILGGYQPWSDIYWMLAALHGEGSIMGDVPGTYYLLRRMADADPDQSGQNWSISVAYYLQAVPGFAVPAGASARLTASGR